MSFPRWVRDAHAAEAAEAQRLADEQMQADEQTAHDALIAEVAAQVPPGQDGKDGADGVDGRDGQDGKDGRYVVSSAFERGAYGVIVAVHDKLSDGSTRVRKVQRGPDGRPVGLA